jgi:hypothetical protein
MFTHRFFRLMIVVLLVVPLAACAAAATPVAPAEAPDPKQALLGNWTSTVNKEDLLRVVPDFPTEYLCENAGTFVWKFNADGTLAIDQTALAGCSAPMNPHIEDTWHMEGNLLTLAKGTPNQESYEIAIDGDQLTFKVSASECPPCIAVNTANPWTRLE